MKKSYLIHFFLLVILSIFAFTGCVTSTGVKGAVPNEMTALELVKLMGNGINLGNTMEAYGHADPGTGESPDVYEQLWGQPITTQEMISGMKEAGFDTLRIPVAWTNTMNFEKGNYSISKAYLKRVEEIVNYALNAEMYVIINDHWDGGWWGMFGSASEETRVEAKELYVSMWTQIAKQFRYYPYQVIFESANEELGDRLNDIDIAADSDTLSKDECYATTNQINQTFVDTIRNSGGNNAERFLLIAGYNTDIVATCDPRFQMPVDTADQKLLLSVHYYTPWSFCGTDSVTQWGSEKEYTAMNDFLKMMTQYTQQGYGIVIGEYGALPLKDGSIKKSAKNYTRNFLNNCDLYDYVPVLWDTGGFYSKTENKINNQSLALLFRSKSLKSQSEKSEEEIKQSAQKSLEIALEASKDFMKDELKLDGDGKAVAWIMYNSKDGRIAYSVGDQYVPTSKTEGVIAEDVIIEGSGTYTVSLDFTGTEDGFANSMMFSALGLSNGELLFPGNLINITELLINGKPYRLQGKPYTTTDDGRCTRVNLYNKWVGTIPPEARVSEGEDSRLSATIVDNNTLGEVKRISITFDFVEKK